MATKNTKLAVCVVESQGIVLYMDKFPNGSPYTFPQGSFVHMEIANYEVFHSFIAAIAQATQLAEHDVVIVFGKSLIFEKQLPILPPEKADVELVAFKDATPFERVAIRTYKNAQGTYLVSTNRDFFDTLRQSIERNGAHIVAILPVTLFGGFLGKQGMGGKALKSIHSRIGEIVELSLISGKVVPMTFAQQEEYFSKQYSGPLIVVFVLFLIAVIGGTGFILRSQFQAARAPSPKTPVEVLATVAPTQTPAAIAELTPATVRIMIQTGPSTASTSAQIQRALREASFSAITEKTQTNGSIEKTLILYRPSVPEALRSQIEGILTEVGVSGAIQENTELETDIWISLGQ